MICPSTGENCATPQHCFEQQGYIEDRSVWDQVYNDQPARDLPLEVSEVIVRGFCVEERIDGLLEVVDDGPDLRTQHAAESVIEDLARAKSVPLVSLKLLKS